MNLAALMFAWHTFSQRQNRLLELSSLDLSINRLLELSSLENRLLELSSLDLS